MASHSPRFLSLVEAARRDIEEIDIRALDNLLLDTKPIVLIDVRERDEYENGHIAGAIHVSKGVIERDIEAIIEDIDGPIYLYCGGGFRSILAAANLKKMGYHHPISVSGGWRSWVSKGKPIEKEGITQP